MKPKKKKDSAEAIVRDLALEYPLDDVMLKYHPISTKGLQKLVIRARALLRAKKGGKP